MSNQLKTILHFEVIKDSNIKLLKTFKSVKLEYAGIKLNYSNTNDIIFNTTLDEQRIYYNEIISFFTEENDEIPLFSIEYPIYFNKLNIIYIDHNKNEYFVSVELIFQSGLIKILFSTETFSMGLNMPAKTVVFTELEKFDGNKNRYLTGGEYIQMSGRAGRRGLDEKGITIVILKKKIDPEQCREIMRGKSDPLNSSFSLSYNQILNLSRIEGIKCEFILQRSFRQYQSVRAIPLIKKKILIMYNNYEKFGNNWERDELINEVINKIENKNELIEYNRLLLFGNSSDLRKKIKPFLIKGRFIYIKNFGIGIFVDYCKINNDKIAEYNTEKKFYEIINDRKINKDKDKDRDRDILESEEKLIDFKKVYLLYIYH